MLLPTFGTTVFEPHLKIMDQLFHIQGFLDITSKPKCAQKLEFEANIFEFREKHTRRVLPTFLIS